jgi:cation:H+ antiporter
MINVIVNLVVLLVSLFLLVKGSEVFVDYVTVFAKKVGLSEFVIGLTLVAFGTSIPELISSLVASLRGSSEIVVGNIIGSNIANIGLILGLAGIIANVSIAEGVVKRDGYLMFGASVLFFLFSMTGVISRLVGMLLVSIYLLYLLFLLKEKRIFHTHFFEGYLHFFIKFGFVELLKKIETANIWKDFRLISRDFVTTMLSLLLVIISANLVVDRAIWVSDTLGVGQGFIALTLIALGTSLPELSISVIASRRHKGDIVLGNILGSNIVNILFILGICSILSPIHISSFTTGFLAPFLMIQSAMLLIFTFRSNVITRWKSIVMLMSYLIFISYSAFMQL